MESLKILTSWFVAGLLTYAFLPALFQASFFTGISFVVACVLSFYKGQVIKQPEIIGYIATVHLLTNAIVKSLLPLIYQDLVGGLFLQATIVAVIFMALYIRSKEIRSVKV